MEMVIGLVVLGVIGWLVLRSRRGTATLSGSPAASPARRIEAATHTLAGQPTPLSSRGRVPVVGESHYQPAIAAAVDGRDVPAAGKWDDALEVQAALVPEPSNRHDRHAVRVDLATRDGWATVGYLASVTAREYQPALLAMTSQHRLPTAPARICQSAAGPLAVYLHLAEPDNLALRNALPVGATVLAAQRQCAVSGETRHQAELEGFGPSTGQNVRVWVTLHDAQVAGGKYAGSPTLEVRLDGKRVGELTAPQAARYRDVVTAPAVACEAEVYAGNKNLEIKVFLPTVD
jgi:hypothetical protein